MEEVEEHIRTHFSKLEDVKFVREFSLDEHHPRVLEFSCKYPSGGFGKLFVDPTKLHPDDDQIPEGKARKKKEKKKEEPEAMEGEEGEDEKKPDNDEPPIVINEKAPSDDEFDDFNDDIGDFIEPEPEPEPEVVEVPTAPEPEPEVVEVPTAPEPEPEVVEVPTAPEPVTETVTVTVTVSDPYSEAIERLVAKMLKEQAESPYDDIKLAEIIVLWASAHPEERNKAAQIAKGVLKTRKQETDRTPYDLDEV